MLTNVVMHVRCSCGASYTLHDWQLLAFVVRMPGFGGDPLEVRQCRRCHSSLSVDVGAMHCHELELSEVQCAAALFWARMRNDVAAERRALVLIALLDRAQGFDHRRWDHLRELRDVRDYRRRVASMAAWRASQASLQVSA